MALLVFFFFVLSLFIYLNRMARLSNSVLKDLGVDPADVPVELPLYSRFRVETSVRSGTIRTRSVVQDLSKQELTAVLLQLTDFRHFRR